MGIKKQILSYAQGVEKKHSRGWFSLKTFLIPRIVVLQKKPPKYPQVMQNVYTKKSVLCG